MELIKATEDYYGELGFGIVYINPNYIISIRYIEEHEDFHKNIVREHYEIEVDYKDFCKTFHISYENGQKLLGEISDGNKTE